MLIKVTLSQLGQREQTYSRNKPCSKQDISKEKYYKAVTLLTQKKKNTLFYYLKAIHNHFQEFCENLRPFVLKKCFNLDTTSQNCNSCKNCTCKNSLQVIVDRQFSMQEQVISQMCCALSHVVVYISLGISQKTSSLCTLHGNMKR